jgi:glycoside/pentoside/hexuronide:cation symporter, GPH family
MNDTLSPEPPLTAETKLLYSLPGLALAAAGLPLFVYIPKYYTDVVGVPAAAIGAAIVAARLVDAASDPLVGILSDRTRTRWGRRRPYMVVGAPLLAALLAALYMPPQMPPGMAAAWFGACLILLSLAWTMVDVPWESLGPEIAKGYDERTALFSIREGLTIAGIILASALPLIVDRTFALGQTATGERLKFLVLGGVFSVLVLVCCWVSAWRIRERRDVQDRPEGRGERPWHDWRETFANRPFRILLTAYGVAAIGANLPATLILYYVEHVLGGGSAEIYLLLYILSGVVFLPAWLVLSRRLDKKKTWLAAMGLNTSAFFLVFFLSRGDLIPFAILTVLSGAGFGASLAIPASMQADVIDYDEFLHGRRREGRFIGVWSVVKKAASALGLGLALPLLDVSGYVPGEEQPAQVVLLLRVLYCLVPCFFSVAAMAVVAAYPLSRERHEALRSAIERRRHGLDAPDPLRPNTRMMQGGAV